jgi:hypothetical protein
MISICKSIPLGCLSSIIVAASLYAADLDASDITYTPVSQLRDIYNNRTWLWGDDRGIYFNPDGRFVAFQSETSYAEGSWEARETGRLCISGQWYTEGQPAPFEDCFEHRIENDEIYSRRMPTGEWGLLGEDSLQEGDLISDRIEAVR